MAALPQRDWISEDEYLAMELAGEIKHEYLDGEVFAMTGASRKHVLLSSSVNAALYTQLRGRPCEVYPADMRVKVSASGLYTYPDISIVCGQPQFVPSVQPDTLVNPLVIIEILSPSTESYDRGKKFQHYRQIPSLQAYVLIAQDAPHIELFRRQPDGETWLFTDAAGLDAQIELAVVGCVLRLADVYEQVTFDDDAGTAAVDDEPTNP
jgi:Uma2 family endonuclease